MPNHGLVWVPHAAWSNWIGDYSRVGLEAYTPRTREDLVEIVELAVSQGKRLRVSGAGHSTTAVARPDDILVNLDAMQGTLPLDYLEPSRESMRPYLVRLCAGTRLKYANRVLLGDKALENMGSFDWQTLIGAISTGTHGSSLFTGPMAESVRSIEMVTVTNVDGQPNVRMRRIEPTDGITDRVAFTRDEAAHNTELIQDDDTFYSSVVSFGAIGLVYSLTLEVVDEYWLKERNEAIGWDQVRDLLKLESVEGFDYKIPRVLAENDFWEFLVNSAEVQGKNTTKSPCCFVRYRNRRPEMTRPKDWDYAWPPRRVEENWFRRFVEQHGAPAIDNTSGTVLGLDIGNRIRKNFENTAEDPPFEGDLDCSRNYWVLRRERDDTKPQEEPDPPPEAISNEIAVPLERTVEAVEMILDIMSRSEDFYAVPFGVRFVGPSKHYLAMQYDRPMCMIEVPMVLPKKSNKRDKEMAAFKRALEAIEKPLCYQHGHLNGRPHWGQYNCMGRKELEDLYDKLPIVEQVYSKHNAFGTFDNQYTRQIGLKRVEVEEAEPSADRDLAPLCIAVEYVL